MTRAVCAASKHDTVKRLVTEGRRCWKPRVKVTAGICTVCGQEYTKKKLVSSET